jgi:hypothetical protein
MNDEKYLELQSWVDGELPAADAARVAAWVSADADAAALATELRQTRGILAGNEPELSVPESREFYWSKIQRAIEREEAAAAAQAVPAGLPWTLAFRRLLVPLSGFALVALVTLFSSGILRNHPGDLGQFIEVENLSEDVDSMSYKSQSENMFVVYVFNQERTAPAGDMDEESDVDGPMDEDSVIQ